MRNLGASTERLFPVQILFSTSCPDLNVPQAAAFQLYYIVQEAIQNAIRHSGAEKIHVEVTTSDDQLTITVRDPGRGFSPASAGSSGLGLRNMNLRASSIGASLRISSSPGQGVTVDCNLPLHESAEAA